MRYEEVGVGDRVDAGGCGRYGADELPLPAVPAEMTVPADRAGYILLHFWDAMDFDDADRSLDRDFMGQNMANFLSVFPACA